AAARGARRPPPLAPRRDARPLPLVRLPLAGDGGRAARPREHAAAPARPGGAADGPRPLDDGGPGRPLHRASLPAVMHTGARHLYASGRQAPPALPDLLRLLVPAHLVAHPVSHLPA